MDNSMQRALKSGWSSEVPTEEGIYVQRKGNLHLILDISLKNGILYSRQNACFEYYPYNPNEMKGYEYFKIPDPPKD